MRMTAKEARETALYAIDYIVNETLDDIITEISEAAGNGWMSVIIDNIIANPIAQKVVMSLLKDLGYTVQEITTDDGVPMWDIHW